MEITITIELTGEEEQKLKNAFKDQTDSEFKDNLNKVASAAVTEYFRMILGQEVFSSVRDIRAYRLRLLIEILYNNRIPDEQTVSTLFQTTPSESKALIRATMSKYKYKLQSALHETLKKIVEDMKEVDRGEYRVVIKSPAQVDELNRILRLEDPLVSVIKRNSVTNSQYIITAGSYKILKEYFEK